MSAMLIEQQVSTPVTTRPRWRHVPQPLGPIARPLSHPGAPGGRPMMAPVPLVRTYAAAPVNGSTWQLTRRGLKVAVALFLGTVALATLTLIGAFFGVSNDPVQPGGVPAAAISQG